jgi:lysyl-tRNA synthetase class 2
MTSSALLASKRERLEARAHIERSIRNFFHEQGFLEVRTPIRTPAVIPEEHIDALESEAWYLTTSPELYMKRLLAAGYQRIFQVAPCFRRGEQGSWHLPEFTLLEWYRSEAGYEDLERDVESLVCFVAKERSCFPTLSHRGTAVDLRCPWERLSVRDAFAHYAGWDPVAEPDAERFELDLVEKVLPNIDRSRPIFLEGYPAFSASLAALKGDDPRIAERVELFVGGMELANGFSELRDPEEQRRRFEDANAHRRASGKPVYPLPEAFLEELSRLPRAAGMALGLDRLVMLLTDAAVIDEVVAFPPPLL